MNLKLSLMKLNAGNVINPLQSAGYASPLQSAGYVNFSTFSTIFPLNFMRKKTLLKTSKKVSKLMSLG